MSKANFDKYITETEEYDKTRAVQDIADNDFSDQEYEQEDGRGER